MDCVRYKSDNQTYLMHTGDNIKYLCSKSSTSVSNSLKNFLSLWEDSLQDVISEILATKVFVACKTGLR